MVGQAGRSLVAAGFRPGIVEAEVLYVPQHMALAVLADRLSPLRAQAPEDAGGVRDLIALNRQAADDKETAAIQDFLLDRFEAGSKAWNRKLGRSDVEDLCAADRCECGLDLRNVCLLYTSPSPRD